MRDYEELVKALRDSADWADHFAVLMGRDGDAHAPIMCEAADAIEELALVCRTQKAAFDAHIDKTPKWISVEERLPEPYVDVLVYCEWVGMSGTTYHEIQLTSLKELRNQGYTPIAWMPLPEPPKEATDA